MAAQSQKTLRKHRTTMNIRADRKPPTPGLSLQNWLTPPVNRVAFRNVRDVLAVAEIANDAENIRPLVSAPVDEARLNFMDRERDVWTIHRFLEASNTDGMIVLLDGRIAFEWYTPGQSASDEHLIFSVTKSVVGSLAGILVQRGQLNPDSPVAQYVPEISGSGYDGAQVRDLLDMTVSLDFEEAYLTPDGPFARYRQATGWHETPAGGAALDMHSFLRGIRPGTLPHHERFDYLSPNSDLLGWVCERAGGLPLATLISVLIWKPMGAEAGASITLDRSGAPRAAGGLGCTLRDMARFGECMRACGAIGGHSVIPCDWVNDIRNGGSKDAWSRGALADWIPGGSYRNQWWITHDEIGAYFASGIYGQWIYICPTQGVTIVRQASPAVGPADKARFRFELEAFDSIARSVEGHSHIARL
jgi:CubicO group peptidase (beta-lactamase class C family)